MLVYGTNGDLSLRFRMPGLFLQNEPHPDSKNTDIRAICPITGEKPHTG